MHTCFMSHLLVLVLLQLVMTPTLATVQRTIRGQAGVLGHWQVECTVQPLAEHVRRVVLSTVLLHTHHARRNSTHSDCQSINQSRL